MRMTVRVTSICRHHSIDQRLWAARAIAYLIAMQNRPDSLPVALLGRWVPVVRRRERERGKAETALPPNAD